MPLSADVVVVDMRLPDGDGASSPRATGARPRLRCLVLTSYSEPDALDAAVRAGASGFLLKKVRGRPSSWWSAPSPPGHPRRRRGRGAPGPAPGSDRLALLTDQERTVLRLIGQGLTNRQIGGCMGLAEKTVKNYTSHLLAKLGLERRTQAAILATELRDTPGV